VYKAEYQDGKTEVKKLSDSTPYDLSFPMPAFTQIFYGYELYNADIAVYLDGVVPHKNADDFFSISIKKERKGLKTYFVLKTFP